MSYKNTAIICLSLNNGGMELAALKIAKLLNNNVFITVIARDDSFIYEKALEYNLEVEAISKCSNFSFSLFSQVRSIIKKRNIRNVIFLGASELKSMYFSFIGLDINLIIRQGTYKSTSKKDIFHRLIYSNVNYFIANSEYIMESVKKVIPLTNQTILKTIYASYGSKEFTINKLNNNSINIVHLGRVVKGKGQKEAVIACNELNIKNIKFKCDFYGGIEDKQYYNEIQKYIELNNLSDYITFHGYSNNTTGALMKSNVFLFPTKGEGFSNAMIEAISYGLVTIVYNNSSMPEMKDKGFYIHLVEDQNQKALNNKLIDISKDIESEQKKSLQNIELAKNVFSKKREKNEYLKLLKD